MNTGVVKYCTVDNCKNEIMEYFDKCEDCLNEEAIRLECEEKHCNTEYWT